MWNFIENELFWLATSMIILFLFGYQPLKTMILKALDERITKIEKELEEASRLKDEAYQRLILTRDSYQESLHQYQELLTKAREEAELIIDQAKVKIVDIAAKGESLLKEYEQQQRQKTIESFKQEVIISVLSLVETELLDKMSYNDQMNILEANRRTFKKIWH